MARYDEMFRTGNRYGRDFWRMRRRTTGRSLGYGGEYRGFAGVNRGYLGENRGYFGENRGYAGDFRQARVDTGDPFNDRARGTPIRMIRGEFRNYGEEFRGGEPGLAGYGREFTSPWRSRATGYGRDFWGGYGARRGYGRDYRRWW